MKKLLPILMLLSCGIPVDSDLVLSVGDHDTVYWSGQEPLDIGFASPVFKPRLDVQKPVEISSCGTMDVLFVIDNSGSMSDNQEKLMEEAPGFIARLKQLGIGLEGGLHVGVVTTDAFSKNPEECRFLGGLVTRSVVYDDCGPYAEGFNFMTEQDDFDASFTCASNVGTMGSGSERQVDAAIEAIDFWHGRPGGCNEGFSRGDALLEEQGGTRASFVLVILTDEDDKASIGSPADWVDHLEWLRGGTLEDSAIISIMGGEDCAEEPFRLQEFLDLVPYSYEGRVCGEDFAGIFDDAVPFIADGCDAVIPEG